MNSTPSSDSQKARIIHNYSARTNSSVRRNTSSGEPGTSAAPTVGNLSTARGSNVAGTAAIAFRTTIIAVTMVGITGSASTAFLSFRKEGFRASSTAVIGSVPLIRIQNIGETTGTKLTMFTSPTSITDITCTTDAIQAGPGLRLAFRFERSSPIP